MKIGNNGHLVLGPFDESTPCLMIVLMNCQTKLRINHLTAVKSVAILESNANLNFYTWEKNTLYIYDASRYFEAAPPTLLRMPRSVFSVSGACQLLDALRRRMRNDAMAKKKDETLNELYRHDMKRRSIKNCSKTNSLLLILN
ncbi:alpha-2 adrenergic receptor [Trichonephila clavipes]|uniref:Alpha-2 adrenergic receptor n=1 Tax=Trichonephila clavipes TaxID=2585209 RepID=A0A8X6RPN1_TRICX|nr:alpha-2 adrenergic receptor [Trichonephila clavipes]